ncbi:SCO3374 family protein [Streptomyces chengbuensis]|uniref:SCO3374 family protein n=1 Tax=Streptomyces TaxID=1883 RepID=UPI0025B4D5A6|nr:SCO3374 family protein [Streptomyces sp. HUAS CB01]WJY51817.1 SCO3374 family protein [Streptomyces sp. HUAS CB01]
MAFTLPAPRVPLDDGGARWYKNELGWATAEGPPVRLITGLRFDVLELPADAGTALLRRCGRTGPVARAGNGILLLVAAGSAEELPGLLDWLEWGGIGLELTAHGRGGCVPAPAPPGCTVPAGAPQGAAEWLRPPKPGREVEPSLPAFAAVGRRGAGPGGAGGTPDLVRLVDAAANACHRARLMRTCAAGPRTTAQPLAFS